MSGPSDMPLRRLLLLLAATGLLFSCELQAQVLASGGIATAYVVLGTDGAAFARVLTTDTQCPLIRFDAREVRMNVRAAPASMPLRPTRSAPADSKPSVFPLLTCEKEIPRGTGSAKLGTLSLPLPKHQIDRIVVIGDSGCRLKKSDGAYQACNDSDLYPFARVAAAAARWKPDLVVHVGDFLYRENECAQGNPGCAGSPWGYGWDAWQADFFRPAAALLQAAPWVMVRGNHESCSRAGQGWWRMMDPHRLLPAQDCNDPANDQTGDYSDPYAVPLGSDTQLIVLDTSNTPGSAIPPGDIRRIKYRNLYRQLEILSRQAAYNIVANHHPLLGFATEQGPHGAVTLHPGNLGLQSVFGAINPLLMPPRIDVLLSGHVHMWQQLSFSSPHPTQFVAGFSGTMEDLVPLPARLPPAATPAPGAVVEQHDSWVGGFGFMTMQRKGPGQWQVKVWDSAGRQINTCSIYGRRSSCAEAQVK
ncbi:MAG: Uncharacterized protein AWT59_0513 [Candidatus Gallionella acididurans]|uniref:Calcineurin-like phosphoesterase domain-containing protein n=1 Tax=Candidatus Gallionella acididurans TaxID=1796491 RepID=A0A139BWI6_9PROT|nr:MAG: Uncharacterized protein AWT59_0513 [Candidatus Gallionella acididurans]